MLQDPVQLNESVAHFLMISSGIFWTITYLLILRRGFLDRSYGMPKLALCANLSWEFVFSFIYPHPQPQLYIDYLWLLFDLGILYQYLLLGRGEFPAHLPRTLFYPTFGLSLLLSALFIVVICREFKDYIGIYAAFAQNLLMSVLFIRLLLKRNSSSGQSLYIALSKMIGTVFPSILFYLYFPHSQLLFLFFCSIFIFDLAYFLLLYFKLREEHIRPWSRL
jgi:hypothetical protein